MVWSPSGQNNPARQPVSATPQPSPALLRRRLLVWYDRNRRVLPWRAASGATPDPYRVWLSEIMLQQTTVAAVIPYFEAFFARWPTISDLAGTDLDAVLHAWQGLGYYARARNMHACAGAVIRDHGGRLPDTEEALRRLPGIGAYTAAAIAAIAFGRRAAPVDGNVVRVLARLYVLGDPLPGVRTRVQTLAQALTPASRPGDFAQALMDLGATVCTPRKPVCGDCPWRLTCAARRDGAPEAYPVKARKGPRPTRRGVIFWAVRGDGAVLLRRRAETGLLGGMMEFPSTEWRQARWPLPEARALAPVASRWRRLPGIVRHTFTHFHLELTVLAGRIAKGDGFDGVWCPPGRLSDHPLPTLMKKVARHAGAEFGI
jgi:A/G-specific adenine glycosylase